MRWFSHIAGLCCNALQCCFAAVRKLSQGAEMCSCVMSLSLHSCSDAVSCPVLQVQTKKMEEIVDLCADSPEGTIPVHSTHLVCSIVHMSRLTWLMHLSTLTAPSRSKETQRYTAPDSRPGRVRSSDFRALWGEAMPHAGPASLVPNHADEPIRWNRVRRRSSSRTARLPADAAPCDTDVVCGPPDQQKMQDTDSCSRYGLVRLYSIGDFVVLACIATDTELSLLP